MASRARKKTKTRSRTRSPKHRPPTDEKRLEDIEILEDRADTVGPRDGFLRLARLIIRNRYDDGTESKPYACDIVSRPAVDAVTVVLFQRQRGSILVGLREGLRPPVWLRRRNDSIPFPDDHPYDLLLETVAGVLEPEDADLGPAAGIRRRAAAECLEEAGLLVRPTDILDLGAASFPTPGITDEKVYFTAAEVDFAKARRSEGDGSTMEELGRLVVLPFDEALTRCRDGRIPDMKTEIGLFRLRDRLGAARE